MLNAADLPDDVEALKALVLRQQAEQQAQARRQTEQEAEYQQLLQDYEQQVSGLREQLNLALAKRFGTSSEQLSPDQLRLFCEPVDETEPATAEEESVEVPAHARQARSPPPAREPAAGGCDP